MSQINFNPFPNLESERLIFKRLTDADLDYILELRGNTEAMKYIPRPLVTSIEEAKAHLQMIDDKINTNTGINWGVFIKDNIEFVGFMGIYRLQPENYRGEIGYMILPKHNGKGLTTEAVKTIITFGFNELNLHSIEGVIDPENTKSERVLQKNGFIKEAHLIENEFANGKFWDTVIYSLLKRNFRQEF